MDVIILWPNPGGLSIYNDQQPRFPGLTTIDRTLIAWRHGGSTLIRVICYSHSREKHGKDRLNHYFRFYLQHIRGFMGFCQ